MSCVFNKFNLDKVKQIEKTAYPEFMWQFQDVETPAEAAEEVDCDGDFFCHIDNGWYILGCNGSKEVYIEDLASVRNLGFSELNTILRILRGFGSKLITADCRSATSYRLLKIAERRGSIQIISESPWSWEGETMYELSFKVKPESFKEWLELSEALDQQTKTRLQRVNPKVFPDRAALEKIIQQMEQEPEMISSKDAFARLNQVSGNQQVGSQQRLDATIQKANSILPNPSALLQALQKEYQNKRISNPELLSLTYLSAKGAGDEQISQLAQEIKNLPPESRRNLIMFPNDKPILKTPNGVVTAEDITQFSSAIHALTASNVDISKQTYFDPKTDIRPERQKDLVIAKNGIYIYRGSNPMSCRTYGKGASWCIASSSSTTWYFTYRHDHKQTQYFIFDTNKDEDDPARIVNPGVAEDGGYSEWVDLRNNHENDSDGNGFGINGYDSIEDYKEYLAQKLGISMEQLNTEVFKVLPITKEEEKLKYYLDAYAKAS
jgi:hypothetical protein